MCDVMFQFSDANSLAQLCRELNEICVLVQAAFLPTMPEDMVAVAQQALGQLQWYCK